MTLEPLPRDVTQRTRAEARTRAQRLSGGLGVLPGVAITVLLMLVFIVLDYRFDQDPHRVLKVGLGALVLLGIVGFPKFGLLVFPLVVPVLPWIPPTPIPGLNAINVLLFTIFGSFALPRLLGGRPLFRTSLLGKLLGVLFLLCALSIVRGAAFPTGYTFDVRNAVFNLIRTGTSFLVYFFVLAMVSGPAERRRIWWAVMGGLMVESTLTILLGRNGPSGRAIGSIGQANELGAFLVVFAVALIAMLPAMRGLWTRVVLLATFGAASFGIVISVSRAAMIAYLVGLVIVALRTSRVMLFLIVLGALSAPLWIPDYVKDRISGSQVEVEGSDEVALDRSSEARLQTWQSILEVVKDHPLDGIGFTGLASVLPDIGSELGLDEARDAAHNTYLRVTGELGIIGLAVFAWLIVTCWRLGDRAVRIARNRFDRAIGVGVCAATVGMAISCAFGDRFFSVVIANGFWMLCALAQDAVFEQERAA